MTSLAFTAAGCEFLEIRDIVNTDINIRNIIHIGVGGHTVREMVKFHSKNVS